MYLNLIERRLGVVLGRFDDLQRDEPYGLRVPAEPNSRKVSPADLSYHVISKKQLQYSNGTIKRESMLYEEEGGVGKDDARTFH